MGWSPSPRFFVISATKHSTGVVCLLGSSVRGKREGRTVDRFGVGSWRVSVMLFTVTF